jgi:putative phage-type endonuclease
MNYPRGTIIDAEQGTPEWAAARAGKVTASCVDRVLARIKVGEAAARRDYRAQLVAEILTGQPQGSSFVNAEMQWGIEQEPLARYAYDAMKDCSVQKVGFITHPTIERAGASPDGLVGDVGGVEIKCPKTATHLMYLLDGIVPSDYQPQMLWQMACAGLRWVDFVSFDPRLPAEHRLLIVRMHRDDKRIAEMEQEVRKFLLEVEGLLQRIEQREAA